jgi:phage tail protein X
MGRLFLGRCASTVLTSNKGFAEWAQILGDGVMAAALTPENANTDAVLVKRK